MSSFNHIINDFVIDYYMRNNQAPKLAKLREDLDKGKAKCLPNLGRVAATEGVGERMLADPLFEVDVVQAIVRHSLGDWGDLCDEDKEMNDASYFMEVNNINPNLHHFNRIMSVYKSTDGTPFWIITESDRSATTILFPEEY